MVAIKLFVPNWQSRRGEFWACGVKHPPTAKPSAKKRSFPMTRRGAGVKGPNARSPSASNSVRHAASCSKSVMAPRGRFQRYPSSTTTTPYHNNGSRTGVFAGYFTDGSYWRVLTVHIASLEVRKGSIAPFGTPSSNDAICACDTFKRRLESTLSGHASGHSSRSACDGGCQIRGSSICAKATARASEMRPITR
jgi:hypothetical protein